MTSVPSYSVKPLYHSTGTIASNIAVVIPCYQERNHILGVLSEIGQEATTIYVVDDACPDNTGDFVQKQCSDNRIVILKNKKNLGVGGATKAGYRRALEDGAKYIVKIDGDGQMPPTLIPSI